ncbi:chorismate mutase [Streptomyces regensis]|nr:chorismate mutase [Streptomyces regensis]
MRHRSIAAFTMAVLAVTVAPTTVASAESSARPSLEPLARLSAERILIADDVAAAKYRTGQPIDDPAREQQVLDGVAAQARALGTDSDEVVGVFRDQIEASKVVQRGLFRIWDADPSKAPTSSPDLSVIRVEINRISSELVQAIADTEALRSSPRCGGRLLAAYLDTDRAMRLDMLHSIALGRSLPHVCESK